MSSKISRSRADRLNSAATSAQISSISAFEGGAAVSATMLNSWRTSGTSSAASAHMSARHVSGVTSAATEGTCS